MKGVCTICHHPRHNEINVSLLRIGIRPTARQFALSVPAVDRHKKHLPKQFAADPSAGSISDQSTLLDRVEALLKESEAIADAAKREKDWPAATAALREARTCLELLAKVRGELQIGTQVRVGVAIRMQEQTELSSRTDHEIEVAIALQVRDATGDFDEVEIERLRSLTRGVALSRRPLGLSGKDDTALQSRCSE